MTNLNKIYHKGKYRSGEWAKHLRPYLKRLGNKKFRKDFSLEGYVEELNQIKYKKKRSRKWKVKITHEFSDGTKRSEYKSYKSEKDMKKSLQRPSVIRYLLLKG